MYEEFFGFQRTTFCRDLPPEDLFSTAATQELNARLRYTMQQRFFMLLTGEVGAGKSTQIRLFVAGLNPATCRCLYIYDSDLTPRNFYWEALHQLGCEPHFYRGDAKRQLVKALTSLVDESKKSLVMIIDEGHLLKLEMLEELRFLLNFHMDSYTPMSLVLAGQPELKETLKKQALTAITQRINLRFHLPAFDEAETAAYIKHQLKVAGISNSLFTDAAISLIHSFAGGIARSINELCKACLRDAAARKRQLIDDHMARVVIETEYGD